MGAVTEYLAWCRLANHSPNTIRQYRSLLTRFEAVVGDARVAGPDEVAGWLRTFEHCAPETRRAARSALSAFYRWCVEVDESVPRSPMGKIPPVKVPQGAPRPIPAPALAAALETADARMRCWLLLGLDAGLRRAEIARVRREDIHGRVLIVVGKGGRARMVPLSRRLAAALADVDVAAGPLWSVTPDWVGRKVAQHLRACGVDATAHRLRHSFACRVYVASGGDLLKTQRLLGHASPTTTARYAMDDGGDDLMDRLDAA